MKYGGGILLVLAAGFFLPDAGQKSLSGAREADRVDGRAPVVVELFTSEGCSSCPPADALLAELESRQPLETAEIIAIEEHVDYWDQQGWVDPFSSANWTNRQYVYSGSLKNGSPYTPQMVVDGKEEFVGSRTAKAREAIENAAAARKVKVNISEVPPARNRSVILNIGVERLLNSTPSETPEVLLAITEAGLHSSVTGGENTGRELRHASVLRELKVIGVADGNNPVPFTAQRTVKLNSAWKSENLRAVVFVQEKKSRRILGAAAVEIAREDRELR